MTSQWLTKANTMKTSLLAEDVTMINKLMVSNKVNLYWSDVFVLQKKDTLYICTFSPVVGIVS